MVHTDALLESTDNNTVRPDVEDAEMVKEL